MDYNAIIVDFNFHPMVELMDSILQITVDVPELGHTVSFDDRGSIEHLSRKYAFTIEKGPVWDFNGFTRRRCVIRRTPDGFRFLYFI